jgi:hypothetical protein
MIRTTQHNAHTLVLNMTRTTQHNAHTLCFAHDSHDTTHRSRCSHSCFAHDSHDTTHCSGGSASTRRTVIEVLRGCTAGELRAVGAAIGTQLLLAELSGVSRGSLDKAVERLFKSAPAVYARAVMWISERCAACLHAGPVSAGTSSGGMNNGPALFVVLCRTVAPAVAAADADGVGDRVGLAIAATVALCVARPVLAEHADEVGGAHACLFVSCV